MTDLGMLRGGWATDINNSGQLAGSYINKEDYFHAFITGSNGTGMTELGVLGGNLNNSVARDINDYGQVVGDSYGKNNASHAFITGPNGLGMIDIGTLGGTYSNAISINEAGQVIGEASTADGSVHSYLYANGSMTDLSLLPEVVSAGWTINVTDINNNGQIVGYGFIDNDANHSHSFMLSFSPPPIPEPSTYAMLLAGLGLIGFMGIHRM